MFAVTNHSISAGSCFSGAKYDQVLAPSALLSVQKLTKATLARVFNASAPVNGPPQHTSAHITHRTFRLTCPDLFRGPPQQRSLPLKRLVVELYVVDCRLRPVDAASTVRFAHVHLAPTTFTRAPRESTGLGEHSQDRLCDKELVQRGCTTSQCVIIQDRSPHELATPSDRSHDAANAGAQSRMSRQGRVPPTSPGSTPAARAGGRGRRERARTRPPHSGLPRAPRGRQWGGAPAPVLLHDAAHQRGPGRAVVVPGSQRPARRAGVTGARRAAAGGLARRAAGAPRARAQRRPAGRQAQRRSAPAGSLVPSGQPAQATPSAQESPSGDTATGDDATSLPRAAARSCKATPMGHRICCSVAERAGFLGRGQRRAPVERVVDAGRVDAVEGEAVGGEAGRRGALGIVVHVEHRVVQAARAAHDRHRAKPARPARPPMRPHALLAVPPGRALQLLKACLAALGPQAPHGLSGGVRLTPARRRDARRQSPAACRPGELELRRGAGEARREAQGGGRSVDARRVEAAGWWARRMAIICVRPHGSNMDGTSSMSAPA